MTLLYLPFLHQCINNEARKLKITQSLELPDRTLQFVKDNPLMDQAIEPIGEEPLLIRRGATFTRIVVNQAQAADGQKYHVMFIATGTSVSMVSSMHLYFFLFYSFHEPVQALDQTCCFVQTEEGTMLKAVNYNGEMFIIEEVQLFQPPQPIKIVTFSNVTVI